jgi:hypothetical protein
MTPADQATAGASVEDNEVESAEADWKASKLIASKGIDFV